MGQSERNRTGLDFILSVRFVYSIEFFVENPPEGQDLRETLRKPLWKYRRGDGRLRRVGTLGRKTVGRGETFGRQAADSAVF